MITEICTGPGQTFQIVEREMDGALGCIEPDRGIISLNESMTNASKHLILLHEILHLCEEKMKQAGIMKRASSEKYIESLAGTLFGIMATSGMIVGVTPDEAMAEMLTEDE